MPVRLAACDPCRYSRLACDHSKPVCSRCRDRNQAANCAYRERPFKKRRNQRISPILREVATQQQHRLGPPRWDTPLARAQETSPKYPNPGYLGSSSHASIYEHLRPSDSLENARSSPDRSEHFHGWSDTAVEDADISRGTILVEQATFELRLSTCVRLVGAWTAKGVNLALAGPFTNQCAQTIECLLSPVVKGTGLAAEVSRTLFLNSYSPLNTATTGSIEEFSERFCHANARWETLGLFFTAASRAAIDLASFESLYTTDQQRRNFQKLALHYADRCLDISLSLDCLNDLQLLLQYENFINHSFVDGDQSYHSWRKLGDVISSLYALGYHEQIEKSISVPAFLKDLRRAAFARAYSADKNVSIFLGRPPRIHKKYCRFNLPGYVAENVQERGTPASGSQIKWTGNENFDYLTDTKWSALCAILKEDILDLFQGASQDERIQRAHIIKADAEAQWLALPPQFRLEGALRLYEGNPIDRDLVVSMRLNHLHVLFLLQKALLWRITEPDTTLDTIAANMLSLVVETMILKGHLANSGTGLVWRVTYYGLPAAGMICLSLLHQSFLAEKQDITLSKVVQDLSVFVAQIEAGALVHFEHSNYALLAEATRTIKNILNRVISGRVTTHPTTSQEYNASPPLPAANYEEDFMSWADREPLDFEIDFWLDLAEHPALSGSGEEARLSSQ